MISPSLHSAFCLVSLSTPSPNLSSVVSPSTFSILTSLNTSSYKVFSRGNILHFDVNVICSQYNLQFDVSPHGLSSLSPCLLQQSVLLPQQRCPAMLSKFLLNGQLCNVAFSTALAQVLVKSYLSHCKVLLIQRSGSVCLLCVA